MESIISTFHIDWKIIIAQVINFGVVFTVLYLFALKPLAKTMKDRTEKIEKGIKDAKENSEILNITKKEYEDVLVKARNEANKIFEEGKKEAEAKKVLMMEQTKVEVASMIKTGKESLENEKSKMVAEAKEEITTLSVKIAEKILGTKIDTNFDDKTVKELNNI